MKRKGLFKTFVAAAGIVTVMATATYGKPVSDVDQSVITAATTQRQVLPGGLIRVDVYLQSAKDISGYQLKLTASGGTRGSLELEGFSVDKSRQDSLFGNAQVIETMAPKTGELLVIRQNGNSSADSTQQVYLATATFRASPDASGAFTVNIDTSDQSLLIHAQASKIAFRAGPAVQVTVGKKIRDRINTESRSAE